MDLLPSTSKGAEMQYPQDSSLMLKMLNTDCLYTIFSYLNVCELIGIEGVCHRFKEIAEMIYKTYQVLNFDQIYRGRKIVKEDVMKIARRVGPNVQTLTATRYFQRMIRKDVSKLIYIHCKNLRKISLDRFPISSAIVPDMAIAFKNLTEAVLPDCNLTDDSLMALLPLNQIEKLNVAVNCRLKGTFLAKLEKIKFLELSYCRNIDIQLFKDFCTKFPQLENLGMVESFSIIKNCLGTIAKNLMNLESFAICGDFQDYGNELLDLANLPKLKHLEIHSRPIMPSMSSMDIMDQEPTNQNILLEKFLLAVSTHNRLEHLNISDRIITNDVKAALANLQKLKVLQISNTTHFDDRVLKEFSCFSTLQKLYISNNDISVRGLMRVIRLSPLIKYIDVTCCEKFSEEFDGEHIKRILGYVKGRPHALTIQVDDVYLPSEDFHYMLPLYHPRLKIIYGEGTFLEWMSFEGDSSENDEFFASADIVGDDNF